MSQTDWQLLPAPTAAEVQQLHTELNISPLVAGILIQRGYDTVKKARAFLNVDFEDLHDPMELHDMAPAIERLQEAVFGGEKIVIYGDYDLDGVTATTVMYQTLQLLGAEVEPYIPNRFEDGYGPNLDRYKQLIDDGAQLIVTVDNGVSGYDAVDYAQKQGVDVIITDHHSLPDQLPPAFAIVHPRHPEGDYPFGDLSGVGVAFKVAQALINEGQAPASREDMPTDLLDLVALGEIGDMVSLTDENRTLVSWGLEELNQSPRPGIAALLKNAKLAKDETICSETVSFKIAPRINAVGRLGDAKLAMDLLLAENEEKAKYLASQIEAINAQRQDLVEEVFGAAKQIALQDDYQEQSVVIVAGEAWHQGILGIVASRLVDLLKKPVVVLSLVDGAYKGSGRSFGDFNLFDFMDQFRDHYLNFGGHAGALGLTVDPDQLSALQAAVAEKSAAVDLPASSQMVTAKLKSQDLQDSLFTDLAVLEPYGTDNPRPVFEFDKVDVISAGSMGTTNQHLKLKVSGHDHLIEAVGFNHPDWVALSQKNLPLSFTATVGMNYFRGRATLQLMMTDLQAITQQAKSTDKSKAIFGQVYKYLLSHHDLDYVQHLQSVCQTLRLTPAQFKVIIQVFLELDFVKINGGQIEVLTQAAKKPLSAAPSYRKYFQ
ncbi:single-stranded-DNA-specific exonuclease RecJ [Eupransor demetentiae]|uniref:Single-stranded-DNA-specific exonuclease RecJ n=1 Tax=Eupransor demetentiae TaxID=3109584 RepID=A0ABM9N4T9_9LACO|nr:DHH superfamily [Lactobacillaceae bacterium LMG 33000]